MNVDEVLGISHKQLGNYCGTEVHLDIIGPLTLLCEHAAGRGLGFAVASGYRSFERQLTIWNQKVLGLRPVLDDHGRVLNIQSMSSTELMFAMLRWSALPGASRHHWGTDVDVYDSNPCKEGYVLQLTVAETLTTGIFAEFYAWLDMELSEPACPFYRPYSQPMGGVSPEPWHLSYLPLACQYQKYQSKDAILDLVESTEIGLKSTIIDHFDEIYERFIVPKN